jgi:aspartate-semialdehyde dehydrogenase
MCLHKSLKQTFSKTTQSVSGKGTKGLTVLVKKMKGTSILFLILKLNRSSPEPLGIH